MVTHERNTMSNTTFFEEIEPEYGPQLRRGWDIPWSRRDSAWAATRSLGYKYEFCAQWRRLIDIVVRRDQDDGRWWAFAMAANYGIICQTHSSHIPDLLKDLKIGLEEQLRKYADGLKAEIAEDKKGQKVKATVCAEFIRLEFENKEWIEMDLVYKGREIIEETLDNNSSLSDEKARELTGAAYMREGEYETTIAELETKLKGD
jgi:hypothetical protein